MSDSNQTISTSNIHVNQEFFQSKKIKELDKKLVSNCPKIKRLIVEEAFDDF